MHRHLMLWPWMTVKRCLLCGAFNMLKVGGNTISLSPAGDVIRWSGTQAALALGDLGMNVATGRPSAFISGAARNLIYEGEGGMQKSGESTVLITLPDVVGTNRDLFDGGAVIDDQIPTTFNAGWTPNGVAEIDVEVDLRNMAGGDTIIIEFLKEVDGAAAVLAAQYTFNGDQTVDVQTYRVKCTSAMALQGRIRQTAGVARQVRVRFWGTGAAGV